MEIKATEHGIAAGKIYQDHKAHFERMAQSLRSLLTTCLIGLPIHVVDSRAKSLESFILKASKANSPTDNSPRYPNPISDLTDLVGVRIITYFPDSIEAVENIISREFDIVERSDKSKAFEKSGKLGYQSVHFLVRLREPRLGLPEYSPFAGQVAEIQVRTILQHAWAEMEHDIQYKSSDEIPTEIRRRFASLAGLIEIADREFQAIQDNDQELRNQVRDSLALITVAAEPESTNDSGVSLDQDILVYQLERYSALVESEPNQYAHYLGRAKVRFLLGDRTGAISDLDLAEKMSPGHPHIASTRKRIEQGFVAARATTDNARRLLNSALDRLAEGDGEGALQDVDEALILRSDLLHAQLDRALVLCFLENYDGALTSLGEINVHDGSFVKADVLACKCLIQVLSERGDPPMNELTLALASLRRKYDISRSPLRHLRAGLMARRPLGFQTAGFVFSALEG